MTAKFIVSLTVALAKEEEEEEERKKKEKENKNKKDKKGNKEEEKKKEITLPKAVPGLKWGRGGVNRPVMRPNCWYGLCPIHFAIEEDHFVSEC